MPRIHSDWNLRRARSLRWLRDPQSTAGGSNQNRPGMRGSSPWYSRYHREGK